MKARKKPTLKSMTALYKKRGFKRPAHHARQYMRGFNDAKKYRVKQQINQNTLKLTEIANNKYSYKKCYES